MLMLSLLLPLSLLSWERRLLGGAPRIVEMDGYTIDVDPDGEVLFFKNTDRPGVLKVWGARPCFCSPLLPHG
jgi:hypothetical protein